jgi:hypothetical protein
MNDIWIAYKQTRDTWSYELHIRTVLILEKSLFCARNDKYARMVSFAFFTGYIISYTVDKIMIWDYIKNNQVRSCRKKSKNVHLCMKVILYCDISGFPSNAIVEWCVIVVSPH